MFDPFTQFLNDLSPLAPWGRFVVIAALFLFAWLARRRRGWLGPRAHLA